MSSKHIKLKLYNIKNSKFLFKFVNSVHFIVSRILFLEGTFFKELTHDHKFKLKLKR